MNDILTVITQNILPLFLVAGLGFLVQRWRPANKQVVSNVVLNCFSPCLVFASLVNSQLPANELADMALFTIINILLMAGLGLAVAGLLRLSRQDTAVLLLLIMFVNGGNYGLMLNQLRYGDQGLSRAVVYYLTSTMTLYTLGIFIASAGQLTLPNALRRLLTFPAFYAAVIAFVVYNWHIPVPAPLMRGIEIAGNGAIPLMLVLLGMQIADTTGKAFFSRLTVPVLLLRLIAAPLLAVLVASLIGLSGINRSVSIIQASMPSAVFVIILATEFELSPTAVSGVVVVSTLLSPFTIAPIITLLGL